MLQQLMVSLFIAEFLYMVLVGFEVKPWIPPTNNQESKPPEMF
jgi:hypothetical protein